MLCGEIIITAFNFTPVNFLQCNGQSVAIAEYRELFDAIGHAYGGNATHFNVPDLRGATPIGIGNGPAGKVTCGASGGSESNILTTDHMPSLGMQYIISINGYFPPR